MRRRATGDVNAAALYRLMAWLSPSYPIGAFSYSSGIEWAVEAGDITDADALQALARGGDRRGRRILRRGVLRSRAPRGDLRTTMRRCAPWPNWPRRFRRRRSGIWRRPRRAAPSSTPRARHGRAPALDRLTAVWDGAVALPIAVGVASAGHGIALAPALHAYLHAMTANLISTGVRLVPLGQTDGQRVLAALEPVATATAARALVTPLDRGRRRGVPRRSRQHAPRNPIHTAVQVLTRLSCPRMRASRERRTRRDSAAAMLTGSSAGADDGISKGV